mmetsp:Transcript_620/g.2198  ORF Transcript_620/g.2198 Transcript_620/m.2198 type:complete len:206 (+) Transcript_620:632-1249(+)
MGGCLQVGIIVLENLSEPLHELCQMILKELWKIQKVERQENLSQQEKTFEKVGDKISVVALCRNLLDDRQKDLQHWLSPRFENMLNLINYILVEHLLSVFSENAICCAQHTSDSVEIVGVNLYHHVRDKICPVFVEIMLSNDAHSLRNQILQISKWQRTHERKDVCLDLDSVLLMHATLSRIWLPFCFDEIFELDCSLDFENRLC